MTGHATATGQSADRPGPPEFAYSEIPLAQTLSLNLLETLPLVNPE